jgi:hypothetical protein
MAYEFNPLIGIGLEKAGSGGGGGATELSQLSDVDLTTPPADGEALLYDEDAEAWVAGAVASTTTPGGSDTQVQFNDDGDFGGSADLTWDDTGKVLEVGGDINLDDGGTYTTTLQVVTPTANRTISYPDATGTLALVAGSSGQAIYNDAGAYSGLSTVTTDGTNVTLTGRFIGSLNGAASAPPATLTGTWFTGGTATTTKPQLLLEPAGATSTAWSTSGTGLGVNAASGFAGNLLDLQVNGTSQASITGGGVVTATRYAATGGSAANTQFGGGNIGITIASTTIDFAISGNYLYRIALNNFTLRSSSDLSWSSTTVATGAVDLAIARDAANTLAQRNGTNAQTTRIYNTFTSATNFERAKLQWDTNVLKVGTEKGADGGTARDMELQTDGTTRLTVGAAGGLAVTDANDIALGTTTGTKIGTATTQKLAFYNATPVVQPTAVADITTTATAGSLPTPDGSVTIADATTPTVTELLEYCVELEAKLEAALAHLRTLGLIAT